MTSIYNRSESESMRCPFIYRKTEQAANAVLLFPSIKGWLISIAVRLRGNKKVQNLSAMWYKEFAKNFATQGDFGHESP